MRATKPILIAAAVMALVSTACARSTPAAPTPAPTVAAAATRAAPSNTKQVSANSATSSELIAAFTANGVTAADRWAKEVKEYRPYDTSDPSLSRLRKNLEKYKASPDTVDKIVASLKLP